jgi:hypothetical protein
MIGARHKDGLIVIRNRTQRRSGVSSYFYRDFSDATQARGLARIFNDDSMSEAREESADRASAERARAALIDRLEQLGRKPVKPPKSLQPTPEAAKSKIRRLRRKRLLLQRTTRVAP